MGIFGVLRRLLRGFLRDRMALVAENLALRQQLNVLQRSVISAQLIRPSCQSPSPLQGECT